MLRCSIRDLALLTLVVALAVGWWMDRRRISCAALEREQRWRECAVHLGKEMSRKCRENIRVATPDGAFNFIGDPTSRDLDAPPAAVRPIVETP
jgi:hypothetical protein